MPDTGKLITNKLSASRQVRVFVSSTFRDLMAERDYLMNHTFPELRKRCRERHVDFVEVDLRWGITEEQAERGESLPICLEEIDRSRPYFIGLLAERYGWVSDQIDPVLMEEQPWLKEHAEKSITELEILHGVLNNPEMAERSYFYFRDPAYVQSIPPEKRADYLSEDEASREKLKVLKDRLRNSGLPVREDYPEPKALGDLVLEDLWSAINEEYPEEEAPDSLTLERREHEAFLESRLKVYIQREEYFKKLDSHVEGKGPPLVVTGESGIGKSALISNWVHGYRERHPEKFYLIHFIGSSPGSANYITTLRRIFSEIKERFNIDGEVPNQPERLVEEFPHWLAMASAQGGMVLILDGLNQIEDRDNAPDIPWLPGFIPENIRLILSTLPGRSLEAIKKRQWPTLEIEGLDPSGRKVLIREYLVRYRKSLMERRIDRIASSPRSENPLYLKVFLDELRVFAVHDRLDEIMDYYLSATTIDALYGKVLDRLERTYEKERPNLVRDALSYIHASRRGLYENELRELLGRKGEPLARAIWSPLSLALEDALVNRSGLLNFFHDYLRQAVFKRYIRTEGNKKDLHIFLADYFDKIETSERKADELPWQLFQAEEWERLKGVLTEMEIFLVYMRTRDKYELMPYWRSLEEKGHDMEQAYMAGLASYEKRSPADRDLAYALVVTARFLELNARYKTAEPLHRRALEISKRALGKDHPDTATTLNNLASLLHVTGRYKEAEPLYRRALDISKRALGKDHTNTATCLNNLALLLHATGRYQEAESLLRRR